VTTIVANLECMAADQRATDDGPPLCHTKKIHWVKDSIFGLAGDVMAGLAVLEWMKNPKRKRESLYKMFGDGVEWRYEFVLLELSGDGLALWNAWGVRMPILDKCYAIGTGGAVALEVVEAGGTPEDGVRRAIKRDQFSGLYALDPDVVFLDTPKALRA
jgi:hypothetical protein